MKLLKKFKYHILLTFLILIFLYLSMVEYVNAVSKDLSDNIFRLHVIANSDSEEDQNLKLKVRDSILKYVNNSISDTSDKKKIQFFLQEHSNEIKQIAENKVKEEGFNYNVKIEIGNFYFPTKKYENISLPSGNYDGLKVKIGKAEGKNWWCVMFPPLCLIDETSFKMEDSSIKILKDNLSNEDFSIISDNSPEIKFKFKIIELLNKSC